MKITTNRNDKGVSEEVTPSEVVINPSLIDHPPQQLRNNNNNNSNTNLEINYSRTSVVREKKRGSYYYVMGFFLVLFLFFIAFNYGSAFYYSIKLAEEDLALEALMKNNRPIIGILAQEHYNNKNYDNPTEQYIAASYVKFVEGGGARAVPILIKKDQDYYDKMFKSINGLLLPGGGVFFNESRMTQPGLKLIQMAKKANEAGDYFPIWGTCQGFEFLIYAEMNSTDILESCNAENVADFLRFTKDAPKSRLFSRSGKQVRDILTTEPVLSNFHQKCLTSKGTRNSRLKNGYKFLSWGEDKNTSTDYVSTIESINYPFYGTQFHPEKNIYEWTSKRNIPHERKAVIVTQYFERFFVNEARKSEHRFENEEEERKYLIYNYNPTYSGINGTSVFDQVYIFDL